VCVCVCALVCMCVYMYTEQHCRKRMGVRGVHKRHHSSGTKVVYQA